MITDLWIENFKGIGKRQHIPLSPITLLFGRNSAGKSTALHALLYLREMVCYHNLNPKKSLGGEQTVNPGGIDNLLHVGSGELSSEAANFTLGCRMLIAPDKWCDRVSWEHARFAARTDFHGYGWEDPDTGLSHMRTEASNEIKFDEYPIGDFAFEIHTAITRRGIGNLKIAVDKDPMMYGWKDSESGLTWWINIWHDRLSPYPDLPLTDSRNYNWAQMRAKKLENLQQKLRAITDGGTLEFCDVTSEKLNLEVVTSVLTCPEQSRKVVYKKYTEPEHTPEEVFSQLESQGSEFSLDVLDALKKGDAENRALGSSIPSNVSLVTLGSFLLALSYPKTWRELNEGEFDLEGAFVGLVLDEVNSDTTTTSILSSIWCVAIKEGAGCSITVAVEKVRLACLLEALAGKFGMMSDVNGFPDSSVPSLGGTEECCGFIGMSLCGPSRTQHDWFHQQVARLDQVMRMGLMAFKSRLTDICYVGPKRSTVPRNLNDEVMDEYMNWGDGLGAWRWLLDCSDSEFATCDRWLSDKDHGLETGFNLEREFFYEVNDEFYELMVQGGDLRASLYDLPRFREELARIDLDLASSSRKRRITLRDIASGRKRHPQSVGEGITQVIPVIAALVRSSPDNLSAIEQPELHLHPSLAAKIGDLIVSTIPSEQGPASVLIETHSEHLILRILRRIRQTTDGELPGHIPPVMPDDVCVLWVDNLGDGTTFTRLRIDERGEFIDRWPKGFFSERAEELY